MIRNLIAKDIKEVNELIADPNYIINEYELKKEAKVFVKQDKIIGFISYFIADTRAELNYIFVDKKYRCQNIATLLMDDMINNCLNRNIKTIDLEVSIENKIAINLYQKYNFKIVNIRKNYYNGIDAYLMIKELR